MQDTILLVAGGTGGHVFPAIALAEILMERGHRVEFITDKRGERFFNGTNIFPNVVASSAMPSDWKGRLKAGLKILQGLIQSFEFLREFQPKAVIGFGGYPSFPTMFAAQLLTTPTIIHEQNAILGRANKQVAAKTKYIATSFPETLSVPDAQKAKQVYTGNPIRKVFARSTDYHAPDKNDPFQLLIFGGSQGSALFSRIIPNSIEKLDSKLRQRLVITQQCRAEDIENVREVYGRLGVEAHLQSFFKNMPALYQTAHLVIGRAGASVAEITAMGRPSLLIPLAASLDGDQAANAQQMVKNGAAWVMTEKDFTAEALAAKLTEVLNDPAQLAAAATAATTLGRANAASKLAELVERVMNEKKQI